MKKWFIYVTDHHEGPFTIEEIRQGITEGKFPEAGFVWAQGMSDWLPMSAVPDFSEMESDSSDKTPVPVFPTHATSAAAAVEEVSRGGITDEIHAAPVQTVQTATPVEEEHPGPRLASTEPASGPEVRAERERTVTTVVEVSGVRHVDLTSTGPAILDNAPTGQTGEIELDRPGIESEARFHAAPPAETQARSKSGILKPVLVIGVVVAGLFGLMKAGVLGPIEEKVHQLFVSIPELPDLSPEDRAALTAAAKTPLSQKPAVEIAVSRADPLSPSFYIASNMPDGTRFDIYLEGVPQTLLNTLEFSGKTEAALTKHVGKSPSYRRPDGSLIPRGEYRVFVVESAVAQPEATEAQLAKLTKVSRPLPASVPADRRIVYEKTLFLGQKDTTYTSRLKEFHDKLASKARQELMELKQYIALLDNQFATTQATFDRLKKQRLGAPQAKAWRQMDSNWSRLDGQLVGFLSKLTPETVKTDYVHGEVFALLRDVQKKLQEAHAFQSMYFERKTSLAETENQLSKTLPDYESLMSQLKGVVAQIEARPTDENGLPKKATITPPAAAANPGARNDDQEERR